MDQNLRLNQQSRPKHPLPDHHSKASQEQTPLQSWSFQSGENRCSLYLSLWDTGSGLQGLLTGGEKPHIGGVVLAVPRPSLTESGWSSDLFITPVPQHKDVDLAAPLADQLARLVQHPVVITAGIHSDSLTPDELQTIRANYQSLMENVILTLRNDLKTSL